MSVEKMSMENARPRTLILTQFVLSDLIKEILERLREPLQTNQKVVRTFLSPAAG